MSSQHSPKTIFMGRDIELLVADTPEKSAQIAAAGYLPKDFIEACAREIERRRQVSFGRVVNIYQFFRYRRAHTYDIIDANGRFLLMTGNPAANTWSLLLEDDKWIHGEISAIAA